MIVSIMQPYLFPYIGYFQLIAQADVFVFHDDVQYIKGGWVNRNRILGNGEPRWITLPVARAGHLLPINQRRYQFAKDDLPGLLRHVESSYGKAPQFQNVFPFLREIASIDAANVADYNIQLIRRIAERLNVRTRLVRSSELVSPNELRGQDRVIDLCKRLEAMQYVNPIGGTELYESAAFAREGIQLRFLESTAAPYPQFDHAPVPQLSIIDVMMFNDGPAIASMLKQFRLISREPSDAVA